MLSGAVIDVLKDSLQDIALIGGFALLCHLAVWKVKQLVGVLSSSHSSSYKAPSGARKRGHSLRAPYRQPVRNKDYYEGYRQALAAKGVYVTHQQAVVLASNKKKTLHYYAGYREVIKSHDVHDYVRSVRQEARDKRAASVYSHVERSYYGVKV